MVDKLSKEDLEKQIGLPDILKKAIDEGTKVVNAPITKAVDKMVAD